MGAKICGFSLPPSEDNIFYHLSGVASSILPLYGDIRRFSTIDDALKEFNPEIVIHLAAQALVRQSYRKPVETYATNIIGTVNLLEAVRRAKNVKVVINVTSDKCYENQNKLRGYKESDPLGGHDPYSSSKGCSELVTAAYRRSYLSSDSLESSHDTAIGTARSGNVIGGGDFAEDRLIPDMVKAFSRQEAVQIRFPYATRPWQHVLEPLAGYMLLAFKLAQNGSQYVGAWNFGPPAEDTHDVGHVVDKFIALWRSYRSLGSSWEPSWITDHEKHPHEAKLLQLDCSKAKSLLGWKTTLSTNQAIEWTVEWYKTYVDDPRKVTDITNRQIIAYETLLT